MIKATEERRILRANHQLQRLHSTFYFFLLFLKGFIYISKRELTWWSVKRADYPARRYRRRANTSLVQALHRADRDGSEEKYIPTHTY